MHTSKMKIVGIFFSAAVVLSACNKDEEQGSLSPSEAKTAMSSANTDISKDVEAVQSAKGFKAMKDLSGLSDAGNVFPIGRAAEASKDPSGFVREAITSLRKVSMHGVANGRTQGDEPYNYNEHKGVYEWKVVAGQGSFVKTGTSTIVEIKFPTAGSNTNNAVFRLTNYAEVKAMDEMGYTFYNPTIIEATLDVDGVKEASLSVKAEYKAGTDDASFADITYFVNPYTLDVDLDDRSTTATSVSETLSNGNDVLIGWSVNATFDSKNPKGGSYPAALTGKVQLRNVIFTVEITAPDQNAKDYNDFIKISITADGRAAGNVVWVTEANASEPTPYVQYADGSKQKLQEVFSKLEDSLSGLDLF